MAGHDEAKVGGVFDRIGDFVVKWPVLVIVCWIAVGAALALLLPPLQVQAAKHQQAPLPPDAPVMQLQDEMTKAFEAKAGGGGGGSGGGGSGGGSSPGPAAPGPAASTAASLLMVVLVDENGLSPADEDVYRKLLDNLRADTADKMSVQDFVGAPDMRSLLESKDKKAWNLPINHPGRCGNARGPGRVPPRR